MPLNIRYFRGKLKHIFHEKNKSYSSRYTFGKRIRL